MALYFSVFLHLALCNFLEDTPKPSGIGPKNRKAKAKRPVHGRPGGAKHGVSFVPGLIDDPVQTAKEGPLATVDQVAAYLFLFVLELILAQCRF